MTSDKKRNVLQLPTNYATRRFTAFSNSSFNHTILRFLQQSTVGPFVSALFKNSTLKIAASFVAVAVVSISS